MTMPPAPEGKKSPAKATPAGGLVSRARSFCMNLWQKEVQDPRRFKVNRNLAWNLAFFGGFVYLIHRHGDLIAA